MKTEETYEEGDRCQVIGCEGTLEYIREGDCSCHISPPCHNCVDAPLKCNVCDEVHNE